MLLFDQDINDPSERWQSFVHSSPPYNCLHIEIWRREWPGPRIVVRAEMHPEMNLASLYWREP